MAKFWKSASTRELRFIVEEWCSCPTRCDCACARSSSRRYLAPSARVWFEDDRSLPLQALSLHATVDLCQISTNAE
jgi:hypothetical protein